MTTISKLEPMEKFRIYQTPERLSKFIYIYLGRANFNGRGLFGEEPLYRYRLISSQQELTADGTLQVEPIKKKRKQCQKS